MKDNPLVISDYAKGKAIEKASVALTRYFHKRTDVIDKVDVEFFAKVLAELYETALKIHRAERKAIDKMKK